MRMMTREMTSAEELVRKWMMNQQEIGRTTEDMKHTRFVYGSRIMEIGEDGTIRERSEGDVIIFRSPEQPQPPAHLCRCCSMEYDTEKDALQCCAYLD
ncbi:hypothetical protein [Alkalicoccus urumqiensis]|uniref:Uncharacterized protein n=1 Tax=Alkalicoccus urumqiensis TaxID=1548213 RepID=A0A2P6MHF7_ALKUR|nr:hypothetical protein [Alkalicoccus urumqiensis]PRO65707.1 hypothetical protein C6I21_07340 [Alkalicoccus urumqiensis]